MAGYAFGFNPPYGLVMRGWNWLFFTPGTFKPDPQNSDAWNRGAYLVEVAAPATRRRTPLVPTGGTDCMAAA
jgi:hypothetical protein